MKLASFNIDVDPVDCYFNIHGIETEQSDNDPIWSKGVVRFLDLLEKHEIKATFFVTCSDLRKSNYKILQSIVEKGHEIGNHTFSHNYKLTLMSKDEVSDEIERNHEKIKDVTGVGCVGFRSPGYNTSPEVIEVLKEKNYSYDSSFFPSPMYYLAKWLIINLKKLRGRRSKSIIYSIMDCFGSKKPYNLGRKVRDEDPDGKLKEFPITTVTLFGLPLIGTSAIVFPEFIYNKMLKMTLKRDYINFEAHGIDLCQVDDDEKLMKLRDFQPDLKHSLDKKLDRLERLIVHYKSNGYIFKTLQEMSDIDKVGE